MRNFDGCFNSYGRVQICKDNLDGVYECDLMTIEGRLPKTAKTVLSMILGNV